MMRALLSLLLFVPVLAVAAESAGGFFTDLHKNAAWQFKTGLAAYGAAFPEERDVDDRPLQAKAELTLKSKGALTDATTLHLNAFAQAGTPDDTYHGGFHGPASRESDSAVVDFSEIYLRRSSEKTDYFFGKALIPSGLSTLYSPVNRFHNLDAKDPADTRELGVWQLGFERFIGDNDSFKFVVITHDERVREPRGRSRWLGSTGSYEFTSLDLPAGTTLQRRFPEGGTDNFSYLLTYKRAAEGADWFVTLHRGFGAFPVVRLDGLDYFSEKVRAWSLAAGFALTRGKGLELHGEAIVQKTDEHRDQDFVRYVLGVNYDETDFAQSLGFEKLKFTVEYGGDDVLNEQSHTGYVANSSKARPFKDTVLWKLTLDLNSKNSLIAGQTYNFDGKDHVVFLGGERKRTDSETFRAGLEIYTGADDTHFGRWDRNDRLVGSYTYKF